MNLLGIRQLILLLLLSLMTLGLSACGKFEARSGGSLTFGDKATEDGEQPDGNATGFQNFNRDNYSVDGDASRTQQSSKELLKGQQSGDPIQEQMAEDNLTLAASIQKVIVQRMNSKGEVTRKGRHSFSVQIYSDDPATNLAPLKFKGKLRQEGNLLFIDDTYSDQHGKTYELLGVFQDMDQEKKVFGSLRLKKYASDGQLVSWSKILTRSYEAETNVRKPIDYEPNANLDSQIRALEDGRAWVTNVVVVLGRAFFNYDVLSYNDRSDGIESEDPPLLKIGGDSLQTTGFVTAPTESESPEKSDVHLESVALFGADDDGLRSFEVQLTDGRKKQDVMVEFQETGTVEVEKIDPRVSGEDFQNPVPRQVDPEDFTESEESSFEEVSQGTDEVAQEERVGLPATDSLPEDKVESHQTENQIAEDENPSSDQIHGSAPEVSEVSSETDVKGASPESNEPNSPRLLQRVFNYVSGAIQNRKSNSDSAEVESVPQTEDHQSKSSQPMARDKTEYMMESPKETSDNQPGLFRRALNYVFKSNSDDESSESDVSFSESSLNEDDSSSGAAESSQTHNESTTSSATNENTTPTQQTQPSRKRPVARPVTRPSSRPESLNVPEPTPTEKPQPEKVQIQNSEPEIVETSEPESQTEQQQDIEEDIENFSEFAPAESTRPHARPSDWKPKKNRPGRNRPDIEIDGIRFGLSSDAFLSVTYNEQSLPRVAKGLHDMEQNYRYAETRNKWIPYVRDKNGSRLRRFWAQAYPIKDLISQVFEAYDVLPTLAYVTIIESSFLSSDSFPVELTKAAKGTAFGPFQLLRDTANKLDMRTDMSQRTGSRPASWDERNWFVPSLCGAAKHFAASLEYYGHADATWAILAYHAGDYGATQEIAKSLNINAKKFWNNIRRYSYTYQEIKAYNKLSKKYEDYVDKKIAAYFVLQSPGAMGFRPPQSVSRDIPSGQKHKFFPSKAIKDERCERAARDWRPYFNR